MPNARVSVSARTTAQLTTLRARSRTMAPPTRTPRQISISKRRCGCFAVRARPSGNHGKSLWLSEHSENIQRSAWILSYGSCLQITRAMQTTASKDSKISLQSILISMTKGSSKESSTSASFFFSSRRRHTRLQGDWSSDVCSSDLADGDRLLGCEGDVLVGDDHHDAASFDVRIAVVHAQRLEAAVGNRVPRSRGRRSEERRVGKECRSRWSPYH